MESLYEKSIVKCLEDKQKLSVEKMFEKLRDKFVEECLDKFWVDFFFNNPWRNFLEQSGGLFFLRNLNLNVWKNNRNIVVVEFLK